MKHLVFILCVLSIVDARRRILNCTEARASQLPCQTYINTKNAEDESNCEATIIHRRWFLKAAHCDNRHFTDELLVMVGTIDSSEVTEEVEEFITHEICIRYSSDIGLLRFKVDIKFNDQVQPISFPQDDLNKFQEKWVIMSGRGRVKKRRSDTIFIKYTFPQTLKYIKVRIFNHFQCKVTWRIYDNIPMCNTHICTWNNGGKCVYRKDLPGPAVDIVKLYKLTSVHAKVSSFHIRIKGQMKLCNDKL